MDDKEIYGHLDDILKYVEDVKTGKIITNKYVKQAVERFEKDIEKSNNRNYHYYFDAEKAAHIITFTELLKQYQDGFSGQRLKLEPWQKFILGNIYGWVKKKDRTRRFSKAFVFVGRKNGKSTLMASCLLYDLLLTPGAQCYSAATKRDQSKIIYNVLEQFIKQNEVLFGKLKLYPSSSRIVHPYKAGFYEAMSSESDKMDGLNPSTVVVDEVSAMKNYDIIKVLQSGQGSRPEPLLIEITSGSDDIYSAGKQEFDRSVKILDGSLEDDSFFCILYCIDEGDDWKDSKNDIKANPNLNISIKQEFLDKMRTEALQQPSLEGEFRSKNLGEYVSPISSWIHHSNWEKVMTDEPFPTENFISVGAVDLSKRNDFTAYTIYAYSFNTNKYYAKHMFYFPENQIQEKMKTDSEMIRKWIEMGLIKPTKGYTVDYRLLFNDILDSLERYKVREICYDPYNSLTLQTEIGPYVDLIEINQGIKSMSPMSKGFEESVLKGEIVDRSPILSWMIENATVYTDANGNIKVQKPSTSSSSKRVDGVITSIMALERLKKLIQDGVDLRTPEEIEEDIMKSLEDVDY